jgi:hypothetical protein
MASDRPLQYDMVEADQYGLVDGAGRCKKARDPIDGEVRPLCLLDLEQEPHLLGLCPVEHFSECRDPRSGKARMKAGPGIEAANPLETEIGCEAIAIRRSVDREVVQNDRLAVGVSTTSISTIVAPWAFAA